MSGLVYQYKRKTFSQPLLNIFHPPKPSFSSRFHAINPHASFLSLILPVETAVSNSTQAFKMKKIILDLATSLDGFIEGPNGETDWCILDDDMDFDGFLAGIDTIFYGRVSYDAWGNYQPDAHAGAAEKALWEAVHSKEKFVFSRQEKVDDRARFIHTDPGKAISDIKQRGGKDIWLYGGASLIQTFIQEDWIDIYRISVHPIVLGSGKPLFQEVKNRIHLRLLQTYVFRSGVTQLIYEPER